MVYASHSAFLHTWLIIANRNFTVGLWLAIAWTALTMPRSNSGPNGPPDQHSQPQCHCTRWMATSKSCHLLMLSSRSRQVDIDRLFGIKSWHNCCSKSWSDAFHADQTRRAGTRYHHQVNRYLHVLRGRQRGSLIYKAKDRRFVSFNHSLYCMY